MTTRINGGTSHPQAPRKTEAPAPKPQVHAPQAPAPKNTVAQPNRDAFDTKSKQAGSAQKAGAKPVGAPPERITQHFSTSGRNQIKQLANNPTKKATVNQDGSETRKLEGKTANGKSHEVELTTQKGMLREAQTKYSKTTKQTDATGTQTTKYEASGKSDLFGRTTTSQSKTVSQATGDATKGGEFTKTQGRTEARDQWGNKKESLSEGTKFKQGTDDKHHTTQSQNRTVTTDRFGNKSVTNETSTARQNDKTTVTTGTKDTKGTELTTTSSAKFEEGKYSVGESADWKKNRVNTERSYSREHQLKEMAEPGGFDTSNPNDKLSKAQKGADLIAGAAPKKELSKGEIPKDKMKENNWVKNDPNTFVGTRHGYAGKHEVTLGANGLNASGNLEAKAGVYAETKKGKIDEDKGGKEFNGAAKLEIKGSLEGKAKIDTNGVDASGSAKIGVTAEATATGRVQSKSVTVAGEKLSAGAEVTGKLSASATAEANAKVKIVRGPNSLIPQSAIIEGGAGASAVAKAEAEAKVNAGPFAVKGNIYGSAGAELTAKGSIGYENGKIKINGSLGAAVGLGAGGGVAVEVDVKQIGTMAKNTAQPYVDKAKKAADLNHDGKLDAKDAKVAAQKARSTVTNTVSAVRTGVQNRVNNARTTVTRSARNAEAHFQQAVNNVRSNASRTASNVQRNVQRTVSTAQRNVQRTVNTAQRNVQRTVSNVQRNVQRSVNTAQRNVQRTVSNVQRNVQRTVNTAQRNVQRTVSNVQRNVGNAVNTARSNVNHAVNNARNTVNNAANNVKKFFHW